MNNHPQKLFLFIKNMNIEKLYASACKEKSDINEHLPILRAIAENCNSKNYGAGIRVTEFGTRWGISTTALLAARPQKLTCYDLSFHKKALELKNFAGETDLKMIVGNTLEIEIEQTDFLFIDTYHTYTQLKQELMLHGDKAQVIAMHDTETYGIRGADGKEGLKQAIKEYIKDSYWKIVYSCSNNNGLTVIRR